MENLKIDISNELFDIDKPISKEQYIERIKVLLEPILKHVFKNNFIKQQIVTHKERINFACPYCSDSLNHQHKKRGNIILEGKHSNFFKCFNCSKFLSVNDFFKDFGINLDLNLVNYISNNKGNFNMHLGEINDISPLIDIKTTERYAIDRQEIKNNFGLIEVKGSSVWSWLTKRLQFQEDKFLYNPSKNYILILNLTPSGKILGAQKRMFYGDNKYITFNASKIHELLKLEKVPDEINTLSQLFGILNININKPITVFEGPMDSFLMYNSIGNCGANKSFPLDINVRYWYDYDKTGIKKSIEEINKGNSVFLWNKFITDVSAPYRKKWDLNDIKIWAYKNNINLPNFDNYFSNNPLDIMDL